jgi:broad specificity phosphatase PhoE
MGSIEIRRHSYTKKGPERGKGSHLSARGVAVAREVGAQMGSFDLVLTSLVPRTLETAIAMGFAVDDQQDVLGDILPAVLDEIGHHDRWSWLEPFVHFAQVMATGGPTAQLGASQLEAWMQAMESVGPQSQVLIVSHGRIIEAGLVACFPEGDFAAWGTPFQQLEGVQMLYDHGRFTHLQLLRLPQEESG